MTSPGSMVPGDRNQYLVILMAKGSGACTIEIITLGTRTLLSEEQMGSRSQRLICSNAQKVSIMHQRLQMPGNSWRTSGSTSIAAASCKAGRCVVASGCACRGIYMVVICIAQH